MDLIRLANQNAAEEVARATTREERQNKLLEALARMLGMEDPPADGVLRYFQHWKERHRGLHGGLCGRQGP